MRKKLSANQPAKTRMRSEGGGLVARHLAYIHVISMLTTRSNVTSQQNTSSISGC